MHFITTVLKNQIQILILIFILDLTNNIQLMTAVKLAWVAITCLTMLKLNKGFLTVVFSCIKKIPRSINSIVYNILYLQATDGIVTSLHCIAHKTTLL